MARRYAVILALIGMTIVLLRACRTGAGLEAAIASALYWTAILGAIGFLIGGIAAATVDEAVRQRMEQELAAASESAGT